MKRGDDVFNCLAVELEEEACVRAEDIQDLYLRAVFLTPNTHCCFYFEAVLNKSSADLLERFAKEAGDQDIKALRALSREEYLSFLTNHDSPTKHIIAQTVTI